MVFSKIFPHFLIYLTTNTYSAYCATRYLQIMQQMTRLHWILKHEFFLSKPPKPSRQMTGDSECIKLKIKSNGQTFWLQNHLLCLLNYSWIASHFRCIYEVMASQMCKGKTQSLVFCVVSWGSEHSPLIFSDSK